MGVADEHLAKQVELSRELLSDVEEVERMKSELMKLRRERVKIQQQSRVLMKSLQVSVTLWFRGPVVMVYTWLLTASGSAHGQRTNAAFLPY